MSKAQKKLIHQRSQRFFCPRIQCVDRNSEESKGRPKSGRVWKIEAKRASEKINWTGTVRTSWQQKREERQLRSSVQAKVNLWKERKNIFNWMKSRRLMLDVSYKLLNFVFWLLVFFLFLSIFVEQYYSIQWNTLLVSFGTILIALSFAYGKVLQNLFDSLYLIFLVKPFQVGDCIRVGDVADELIVESVGVMSTYFIKKSTGFGVYISNALLASSKLSNLNRGDVVAFIIPFQVAITTSQKQLDELHKKIKEFLETQNDVYNSKMWIAIDSIERKQKFYHASLNMKLQKWFKHQDVEWKVAQSNLILFLNQSLFELGINIPRKRVN